jgi:hypothetical protein
MNKVGIFFFLFFIFFFPLVVFSSSNPYIVRHDIECENEINQHTFTKIKNNYNKAIKINLTNKQTKYLIENKENSKNNNLKIAYDYFLNLVAPNIVYLSDIHLKNENIVNIKIPIKKNYLFIQDQYHYLVHLEGLNPNNIDKISFVLAKKFTIPFTNIKFTNYLSYKAIILSSFKKEEKDTKFSKEINYKKNLFFINNSIEGEVIKVNLFYKIPDGILLSKEFKKNNIFLILNKFDGKLDMIPDKDYDWNVIMTKQEIFRLKKLENKKYKLEVYRYFQFGDKINFSPNYDSLKNVFDEKLRFLNCKKI